MDVATMKKVVDDVVIVEMATTGKRATDVVAAKMAVDEAVVVEMATAEVATQRAAESSPTLVVGAKRAAVSGSSTCPTKRPFRGPWRP
jgi:hypothetical protein